MENVSVLKKKGSILYPKSQRFFLEIGVFLSLKICDKGSFFKVGNADMSSLY